MKIELKYSYDVMGNKSKKRRRDDSSDDSDSDYIPSDEEPTPKKKSSSKKPRKKPPVKKKISLDLSDFNLEKITNLKELILFGEYLKEKFGSRRGKKTGVLKLIPSIPYLKDLESMIGLNDLKTQIAKQIMFFILGLNSEEMMHTIISGPPGMAKTTVANKLGAIYASLGFLSEGQVVTACRSDLVGQYLGETSIKTMEVLEASMGGILLIDEAYSLGDKHGRDSYSTECINVINQFLSENPHDFMCIFAGYEKELKENLFNCNPGLERRFPWWFKLKEYTREDLVDILLFQIKRNEWSLEEDITRDWLLKNVIVDKNLFKNNGGDTLIFFDKCKITHSQRVILLPEKERKILNIEDLKEGQKLFNSFKNSHTKQMSDGMRAMYM